VPLWESQLPKPLIVGFGYSARQGKDACCSFLKDNYRGSKILVTSFAKRLRKEISDEMYKVMAEEHLSHRGALEVMCERAGVEFNPQALSDEHNRYGKQRKLQQWWGTEFRRVQCATYWLDKVQEEISASGADFVLLSDMRFKNEAEWITNMGGKTVKVTRPSKSELKAQEAAHISEHELADHAFDYTIVNDGSLKQLHAKANSVYKQILQLEFTW